VRAVLRYRLSKIRKNFRDGRRALAERREQLKCGVAVVDLAAAKSLLSLVPDRGRRIFDVRLLPGLRFPEVIGFQQETIQHTFNRSA